MAPAPQLFEHLFVLLFTVVHPVVGFLNFRRLTSRFKDPRDVPRPRLYVSTIAGHWILCAAGIALWTDAGRSLSALGFRADMDAATMVGVVVVAAAIALLVAQLRAAGRANQDDIDAAARSIGAVRLILPHSVGELRGFYAVGLSAGIVEEILWRGYLLAYLTVYLPAPAAALVVIVAFGIAHAYQGLRAIPKVTAVGALFTGLYLLTGSLWLPILLHAAVDVLQGRTAYAIIARSGDANRGGAA